MSLNVWGLGTLLIQSYFSVGEMKYYVGESAPPTCVKGGMVAYANALSPLSASKGGVGGSHREETPNKQPKP